jgi:hypothetical protein
MMYFYLDGKMREWRGDMILTMMMLLYRKEHDNESFSFVMRTMDELTLRRRFSLSALLRYTWCRMCTIVRACNKIMEDL